MLSERTRAMLRGYAEGLNYYVARHPGVADAHIFPVNGKDLAAGFAHKLSLFMGLHKTLAALNDEQSPLV